ncbi:hypothetical protein JZ751_029810 [Albula glossodonta]|uniref:Uncharacterized protein n=1 Tax=Albula glossodonta TaxID=121402 RepID=A0A8T2N9F7_9TELE|nr:hypothetical protein JZ751_029810 [Albula glossodonta]
MSDIMRSLPLLGAAYSTASSSANVGQSWEDCFNTFLTSPTRSALPSRPGRLHPYRVPQPLGTGCLRVTESRSPAEKCLCQEPASQAQLCVRATGRRGTAPGRAAVARGNEVQMASTLRKARKNVQYESQASAATRAQLITQIKADCPCARHRTAAQIVMLQTMAWIVMSQSIALTVTPQIMARIVIIAVSVTLVCEGFADSSVMHPEPAGR